MELEMFDAPTRDGMYVCEVCPHPTIDKTARAYAVLHFDPVVGWSEVFDGASKPFRAARCAVVGWARILKSESQSGRVEPTEEGYYVCVLRPWPGSSPNYKKLAVCIYTLGEWRDCYGWAKQYGDIIAWVGPLPMLDPTPLWYEAQLSGKDIGL